MDKHNPDKWKALATIKSFDFGKKIVSTHILSNKLFLVRFDLKESKNLPNFCAMTTGLDLAGS